MPRVRRRRDENARHICLDWNDSTLGTLTWCTLVSVQRIPLDAYTVVLYIKVSIGAVR